jgi:Zn-dependent protease
MQNFWSLGRWGGIPVSMHWTVLLAFPWLFLMMNSFVAALIGSLAFFFLLVAHEGGHVLVARWRRVYVEDIQLFGYHGQTSLGYKRTELDEVLIAWGGVAVQLVILAAAFAAAAPLAHSGSAALDTLTGPVLAVFTTWNMFLMMVALLPLGPMDGHAAWKAFPMMRRALRRGGRGRTAAQQPGNSARLRLVRSRDPEEDARRAAAEIIDSLGKKKR